MTKGQQDNRPLGNPGSPAFQLDKYPFYLLNRAVSRYNMIIEGLLRGIGLDIPSWRVLMVLGERAPRSMGQIAEASVINLSTMMRIIGRMKKAELVTVASSAADGRVTEVSLTRQGHERLAAARQVTAPIYAGLIDGFDVDDFDHLIAYLDRLHANLGQLDERG